MNRFTLRCALAPAALAAAACGHEGRGQGSTYVRRPLPAGFAEQAGDGWRVSIPSTWKAATSNVSSAWTAVDPQVVDDYRAKALVTSERFDSSSHDYAKATVASLRREARAIVEVAREDVLDGDTTMVVESRWAPGESASIPYRTMQASLAARGTGYVVTCSVSAGAFERYRSTCEAVVRSFAVER